MTSDEILTFLLSFENQRALSKYFFVLFQICSSFCGLPRSESHLQALSRIYSYPTLPGLVWRSLNRRLVNSLLIWTWRVCLIKSEQLNVTVSVRTLRLRTTWLGKKLALSVKYFQAASSWTERGDETTVTINLSQNFCNVKYNNVMNIMVKTVKWPLNVLLWRAKCMTTLRVGAYGCWHFTSYGSHWKIFIIYLWARPQVTQIVASRR